jgi:hypothetical protein
MSFFDESSLCLIPSGYKNQKLYAVKPLDGSGDLTFSRASAATRVASNGLIEKVRTNVALHSNDFSNAAWVKTALGVGLAPVVTANYTTDPFGGNNGWRLQCDLNGGTTSGDRSLLQQTIAGTTVPTTVSIYAKLNSAGTATFTVSNGSTDNVTITSTEWVRVSSVRTSAIGSYIFRVGLFGGLSSSTLDISIAFAQLETGDIATDYIPTTTAAVSVGPVSGLPRLDYLNSTCPRLLLEPQRTNLFFFSEQFDNAYWTKSNTTITANNVTSPDGYTNADLITASGSGSVTHVVNRSITTTIGSVYAFSVFAKKGTTDWIALRHDSGGTFNYFNLATGTKGATCDASATIENYGNGWYRLTVFHTATGSNGGEIYVATANGTISFAAAGQTLYIYGAQYELGSYVSSYVNTLSTSVTRVADAATKTGISSLIGQTEGTIFAEVDFDAAVNTEGYIFRIDESSFDDTIFVSRGDDKILNGILRTGGSTIVQLQKTAFNGVNKLAFAYKSGSFALYVNGTQVATSAATYTNGITYDDIRIGGFNATTANMCGGIKQLLLFTTRLSNSDLAALTA